MIAIHRDILTLLLNKNLPKHMRWNFFVTVNGFTIFAKSFFLDVWQALNTPVLYKNLEMIRLKNFSKWKIFTNSKATVSETYLKPNQISKIKLFGKIVNGLLHPKAVNKFCAKLHFRCLTEIWIRLWISQASWFIYIFHIL